MLNWRTRKVLIRGRAILLGLSRAFDNPVARFRKLPQKLPQGRAEVLPITKMRAHSGAEFRFVNELVRVRAVLERRLRAEQERINVRRRSAPHQLARQVELLPQQILVIGITNLRRQIKTTLNQGRVAVTGAVAVQVAEF